MELDSQSLESDEGLESEHGEIYARDFPEMEENPLSVLEAKIVYILMPKNIPISRAARLQWLLDHLNTIVTIPNQQKLNESSKDLEIISAIPREQQSVKCNRFLITYHTEVKFLSQSYRFVYCLDMSPSQCNVHVQSGELLFDEILNCFKCSIHALIKEFAIPGNSVVFQPCIYLTVMVNTPFFMSPAQQVVVKGVQLTNDNIQDIVSFVQDQFSLLEGKIAEVAALAHDQLDTQRSQSEGIVGRLFDLQEPEKVKIPMVTPDANFVNMLRYSLLAVSLLPEISISHILVITDGVVAMPDSNIMETLLFQLHYDSIAVSFLKVGASFHPHSSAGYVPYVDLLYFFAHSTLGVCIETFPDIKDSPSMTMNAYQERFLIWSFHSSNKYQTSKIQDVYKWNNPSETFYSHKPNNLLSKKQTDENTNASILLLISRRMREGFTVDNIFYMNGNLEVKLSLEWKSFIYIHYKVSTQWPVVKNVTRIEVHISAPYEFLHDITCAIKKDPKSSYRQAIIERFWMRLSQLSSGDLNLAQQLSALNCGRDWYSFPESVRNGIAVFILNNGTCSDSNKLNLQPRDTSCAKFLAIWQPICSLETNNWRKWFHTHKISLILRHDLTLPKNLHLANSAQRYQVVQCRQSATALYNKLSDWATFVLIDNHTYLKLVYQDADKPPTWFCMVRVSSKLPCAVLNIGFVTNTPGHVRVKVCEEIKMELSGLSYLSSPSLKLKENICCVILQKPLEKILIRYERIPNNFTTVIFPDGTQPPQSVLPSLPSPISGSLFTTLSRYLYHKRWIWSASHISNPRLSDDAVSRILSTLTRMRINEGFNFAHSSAGVITMVLELWMEPNLSCLVQYVLFPPHCAWMIDDFCSSSEEENDYSSDSESELQIVTEVWIEPQYGKVLPSNPRIAYMDCKQYYDIPDVISKIDMQCINALLTMEHLSLMCQDRVELGISRMIANSTIKRKRSRNSRSSYLESPLAPDKGSYAYQIITPRIEHIPFKFDPITILPLCQQTELLFSMFIEAKEKPHVQESGLEKANELLLNNILDHLNILHDQELTLSKDDSERFSRQILLRHLNKPPNMCPLSESSSRNPGDTENLELPDSQWRCFIKGISVTHVVLTFVPATYTDLKFIVANDNTNMSSLNESLDSERNSSRASNLSDVPINTVNNNLCLPVYVFDCPLAMLVHAYTSNKCDNLGQITNDQLHDVYEDHRFKSTSFIHEDFVKLKSEDDDSKSQERETNKTNIVKQHCKTLVLTHSKCFTISLFVALHKGVYVHSYDVQSAMDQCDECIIEIDISDYILTICGHVKYLKESNIEIQQLQTPCCEFTSLHNMIKKKFYNMLLEDFKPISSNREFYYYKNLSNLKPTEQDSDDEISTVASVVEFKSEKDLSIYSEGPPPLQRFGSNFSDIVNSEISPLFLHLICTIRYNNGEVSNKSLRVLPTCLGELIQSLGSTEVLEMKGLQVTLDMLCLTLPNEVQNIISDYSTQGLRTTSFSSERSHAISIDSSISNGSYNSGIPDNNDLFNLLSQQRKSIISLRDEIKWLLKDEIATALLDINPVQTETLNFVISHVTESSQFRTSCILEAINLNFVFLTEQSFNKFVEEFSKIHLPSYKLYKQGDYYYLAKDPTKERTISGSHCSYTQNTSLRIIDHSEALLDVNNESYMNGNMGMSEIYDTRYNDFNDLDRYNRDDIVSQTSDISSTNGSIFGTDGGYDDDVSEDFEGYDWLTILSNKRTHLPNFWLIMKVDHEVVNIYFHCRFLELPSAHVVGYLSVQRQLCEAIKDLCKKVNQLLLLQALYDSKNCDVLLEPDDDVCPSPISRNTTYLSYLKKTSEDDLVSNSTSLSDSAFLNFKSGYFSCPVVWETDFFLHPRLKTGPGKSGISRGILALKNILEKFSVLNRNNMFVYRDTRSNVFYLRLHENVQCNGNKMQRSNEYENALVSRSPSIASLPLGQNKANLSICDQTMSAIDIRPRVRSFGEKDTNNGPQEDTLTLKVHGITDAGSDVQFDLVQVLQNRLDDAVLEFLSVMLARNAMCPLTPEDVRFIQKPFKLAEVSIQLSIQDFAQQCMASFVHYLKQNLLQFLNVPKYTDQIIHFKDYTEKEDTSNWGTDDSIFLYNQNQSSSGNRGIACIALAIICNKENIQPINIEDIFLNNFALNLFPTMVSSEILDECNLPDCYIEFRLWKQGRVNIENLSQKLKSAVSQTHWDIVSEYYLLKKPLCVQNTGDNVSFTKNLIDIGSSEMDLSKEIVFNCILDMNKDQINEDINRSDKQKTKALETRRSGNNHHKIVLPTTPKTIRSITFENYEKEKEILNMKINLMNNKPTANLNAYDTGDEGLLSDIYAKYLPFWLEFGYNLNVPAVKKHQINLTSRHLPNITIRELLLLLNIHQDVPKAYHAIPTDLLNKQGEIFVPFHSSSFIQKYVIISRNFEHWFISASDTVKQAEFLDCMSPQSLKHIQKFVPTICNNVFIPRQKILWILVESNNIIIYTYNWTKDNIDKLIKNCSQLGQWLSVRSCFLNSVTSQKLGLYHNQPLTRKGFMSSSNPYVSSIGDVTFMKDFTKDVSYKRNTGNSLPTSLEAFRDCSPKSKYTSNDPVVMFTIEMHEMKSLEKKQREQMKILHNMYQSRTSSTTVSQIILLMQNSRILHYCHTPLLFLPRWRLKSAATRDHSLPSQVIQIADKIACLEKETWHNELCYGFFTDYRNYLQTLGFMPLQIDNPNNKNSGLWAKDKSSYNSIFYIQKTILGGILLFTVEFSEPFFITKLHAIECNRLQNISSRASINRFTLSFLDECDRVKIFMHLHSFTYDYHLRCIFNYISHNNGVNKVCERYNVHQFLDDFMKYYNKAPNFARNLVHADTLTIENLVTEGKQLFDYLLTNVVQYEFNVFEMDTYEGEPEYMLVQMTSTPQVSYKDAQDMQHTDDFDITLVVYNLCTPYNPKDNVLHLKYYLILTSKREIYPKTEVEHKLGKFRTVSSTARSLSALAKAAGDLELSISKTEESESEDNKAETSDEDHTYLPSENESDHQKFESSIDEHSIIPHVELYQESVNYLGYYSSHEQLMQQLILDKANTTRKHIKNMVDKGMVDCRTNLLWNRLILPQESDSLNYNEFMELKSLAKLEHLCELHPTLSPLLNQPLSWYQGLAKLLLAKYVDHHRMFISGDGNIQHYCILHPNYFGAFMLLSIDLHTSRGELYAVYREPQKTEDVEVCLAYQKSLLHGFVNCISFYLWSGMIST